MKKIPIFKAQNVQHTHPGKFVNKFATNIKQEERKFENVHKEGDFFENLKDFVDGIELNIGENKVGEAKNQTDIFLTKDPNKIAEENEEFENNKHHKEPMIHSSFIKPPMDPNYKNHLNSFVQGLYSKYIKKEKTMVSNSERRSVSNIPYEVIHRSKLQNLKLQNQKIFKKAHLYNKDTKVSRFAKSLNSELGRVSNNFGKIESVNQLGENATTQFFFDNTNEYLVYKMLKMREEDKKQKLLPLIVTKDPSIDKLSDGFYKLNRNIKEAFSKPKKNEDIAKLME